jgi:glycosyltransferase involved in cell wall biosynthesis
MFRGKKIVVVMPAYNAGPTLKKTYEAVMEQNIVDKVVVVDDGSLDNTVAVAKELQHVVVYEHEKNMGYGANQKTCYRLALEQKGDIIIMVHPDYQYTPKLITAMVSMIAFDVYDVVIGSRIIAGGALKGGMPLYKYISNRLLTLIENLFLGSKMSEFHTGYRAFRKEVLEFLPLNRNSNDFVFDNEMLAQIFHFGYRIGEVSCPTKYFKEASSINFRRSMVYGLGVLKTAVKFRFHKMRIIRAAIFSDKRT